MPWLRGRSCGWLAGFVLERRSLFEGDGQLERDPDLCCAAEVVWS